MNAIEIQVQDREGIVRRLAVPVRQSLMVGLRDAGYGIDGTCGGMCSCGSCHVYINNAWAGQLPPASEDEAAMLDALSGVVEVTELSRLACQVQSDASLSGLMLIVGPEI